VKAGVGGGYGGTREKEGGGGKGEGREERKAHYFCDFCGGVIFRGKLFFVDVGVRRWLLLVAFGQVATQAKLVGFPRVLRLYGDNDR
jgi:hypothetical protein